MICTQCAKPFPDPEAPPPLRIVIVEKVAGTETGIERVYGFCDWTCLRQWAREAQKDERPRGRLPF